MYADTPRKQAIALIATYDRPDGDAYEQHLVRMARAWLRLLKAGQARQGTVNQILEQLVQPVPEGYGCGWDEFKKLFMAWAIREEWAAPDGTPIRRK